MQNRLRVIPLNQALDLTERLGLFCNHFTATILSNIDEKVIVHILTCAADLIYIWRFFMHVYDNCHYIYSFSRRFYPKRLTIEEYHKRYIIKRQTSRHCSEQILARPWEVKGKQAKLRKESEGFLWWRKRLVFRCRLKIVRDSAFRMGVGYL